MPASTELTLTCECCKNEEKVKVAVVFSRKGKGTFSSEELPNEWRTAVKREYSFHGGDLLSTVIVCSADCAMKASI